MAIVSVKQLYKADFDVVIIGAGTVALYLASVLARRKVKVLLFESGTETLNELTTKLNKANVTGEKHTGIHDARARVVGGTSLLWGGQLAEFTKSDFNRADNSGYKRWPIAYEDLVEHYQSVAKTLDINSYNLDSEAPLTTLFKTKPPQTSEIEFYITHWLKQPNFSIYFDDLIKNNEDVLLCKDSHVLDLYPNTSGSGVSALSLKVGGQGEVLRFSTEGKKVVLANGTMEISRLMLWSAAQHPEFSWAENDNVGAYFQDHLDIDCAQLTPIDEDKFRQFFENGFVNGNKVMPRLKSKTLDLNVGGSVRFESRVSEDLANFKIVLKSLFAGNVGGLSDIKQMFSAFKVWTPLIFSYLKDRRIRAFFDGGVVFKAHMEQIPIKESRISLDENSRDIFGVPLINLDWKIDWDLQSKVLEGYVDNVKKFLESNGVSTLNFLPALKEQKIDYLKNNFRDSYHQCGGAVMSQSLDTGVVDQNCLVFGTENLYVAGAALFPSSSYANPTFTALALADRLADHLKKAL